MTKQPNLLLMTLLTVISLCLFFYISSYKLESSITTGWVSIESSDKEIKQKKIMRHKENAINLNSNFYMLIFATCLIISTINLFKKQKEKILATVIIKILSILTMLFSCGGIYYLYFY